MKTLDDIKDKLSEQEITDLQEITKRIKSTCDVRMIILYGSHARGEQVDESYVSQGKKSDYDILVVPARNGKKQRRQTRLSLKNMFDDINKTVQCNVEAIEHLNYMLQEGEYFYTDIKEQGVFFYRTGKIELAEKKELTPQRKLEIAEMYFKQHFNRAKGIIIDARNAINRSDNKNAAFYLQQCFESCYNCVELVLTRYTPAEHLLVELRKNTVKLDERMNISFPIETEEQQNDFDLLDYAYIGGRYDPNYAVTKEQLQYWMGEAEKLMEIVKTICQEHIQKLKNKLTHP